MYPHTRSNCLRLTMAPMSFVSSSGSPTRSCDSLLVSFATNESTMVRCTNSRDPAVQDCPWRKKRMPAITPSATQSSSASGKTICGFFPPSSSDTGTIRSAAAVSTREPTAVDPVNEILSTSR
jgi:hypothetical protein